MKLAAVFLLLVWAFLTVKAQECSEEEENKCKTNRKSKWFKDVFPWVEAELDYACNDVHSLECSVQYAEKCPNSTAGTYLEYNKKKIEMLEELCNKTSTIREQYLQNIVCVNENAYLLYEKCDANSDDSTDSTEEDTDEDSEPKEDNLEHICKTFEDNTNCVHKAMNETCGMEGEEVHRFLHRPAQALYDKMCKKEALSEETTEEPSSTEATEEPSSTEATTEPPSTEATKEQLNKEATKEP